MTREGIRRGCRALVCIGPFLIAGCVAVPRATNELEAARAAYRAAAADAQVQARAPAELELAGRDLRDAENLQRADAEPARVAHFSYLAEQRARIAQKTAQLRAAEAAYATASEQRDRMQAELGQRERAQPASSGETAR
jgi:Domain of unknown function (DUF4398)